MSVDLPGMGGDFAKAGAAGPTNVYDTSPTGLGLSPAYLATNSASATASGGSTSTTGVIAAFAGSSAPTGWVLCDGSTYDGTTATYAALYAVIGTTYGGTGISSFKVPDLQGRVPVGKGTNASVNALGTNDGVALANRRGPKHRHTPHTHTISASGTKGGTGGASNGGYTGWDGTNNFGSGSPLSSLSASSDDGGSGVATDPLDGGAFLVINYIIAL